MRVPDSVLVGDPVRYVDEKSMDYFALVIYKWDSCLNIIYIPRPLDDRENDIGGHKRVLKTSVPWKDLLMTSFYVDFLSEHQLFHVRNE